ncbi:acetyl-CoA acetyltransferase [Collibacillus ludicampi]|uniref:Acetyl-CoA acetyltransferase n=1 Tax=Collibacillus ludicampi TaxID=2771369 RepID=A0AAV4LIZ5_9BACL|nr:3-oxoadipyl-CoA thiolase [Collibacillus ludicampi]GIM47765.1 acetyl-CoA acetyltransferase [Collibacillus ludicampi]
MRTPVIVDAVRTPIGRYGGTLKDVRPDDLGAIVIRQLLERNPFDPELIDDVIFGCANQAGEDNRNVARMSLLLAGLPVSVPGVTVNRLCGSGLEAVNQCANAVAAGRGDVYIAGGTESMTRAPFVMMKAETGFPRGNIEMFDTTIGWRFINKRLADMYYPYSMGETAENVAERYGITREDQDRFALSSQQKYAKASAEGKFKDEIVPVEIHGRKGEVTLFVEDEHPRPDTTLEKLAKLKPAFRQGGTVTAGNSSGVNDGAAALLVMEEETAVRLGMRPRARIVASAVAGVDPAVMGIGPVFATRKVLKQAGLNVNDIDLIELNEAFAAQALACIRELDLDIERVNVNGGAIALGHPLGCSGARIMTTLLYEMERRGARYGLATMCIGVGQGIATIIERV